MICYGICTQLQYQLSEIRARTCLTYTPTCKDLKLAQDTFNRTVIVEVQIPSEFFLNRVSEAMHFIFNEHTNKINFFVNISSTIYGKQVCFEWGLEHLSLVRSWTLIQIRAYDYLQQESLLIRLFPI
ncbi:unnamed protein product [Rotaria sp. Silwood2]|nr:unnamed protein product [Rotaria sp. Silwood2]